MSCVRSKKQWWDPNRIPRKRSSSTRRKGRPRTQWWSSDRETHRYAGTSIAAPPSSQPPSPPPPPPPSLFSPPTPSAPSLSPRRSLTNLASSLGALGGAANFAVSDDEIRQIQDNIDAETKASNDIMDATNAAIEKNHMIQNWRANFEELYELFFMDVQTINNILAKESPTQEDNDEILEIMQNNISPIIRDIKIVITELESLNYSGIMDLKTVLTKVMDISNEISQEIIKFEKIIATAEASAEAHKTFDLFRKDYLDEYKKIMDIFETQLRTEKNIENILNIYKTEIPNTIKNMKGEIVKLEKLNYNKTPDIQREMDRISNEFKKIGKLVLKFTILPPPSPAPQNVAVAPPDSSLMSPGQFSLKAIANYGK